mmetsp:Transcript_34871/g.56328  ORF Transcript_34871/g.56328 Transcript_34871/m.56328 type:complete len:169 (+) Transcript_34871:589-1095(+)
MLAQVTNDKESVCEFVRIDPKYVKPSDVLQEFESALDRIDVCFHELLPKHWKDQPYKSQTWVLPITPGTLGTGRYGCVKIGHPEPTSQKPLPPYRVVISDLKCHSRGKTAWISRGLRNPLPFHSSIWKNEMKNLSQVLHGATPQRRITQNASEVRPDVFTQTTVLAAS